MEEFYAEAGDWAQLYRLESMGINKILVGDEVNKDSAWTPARVRKAMAFFRKNSKKFSGSLWRGGDPQYVLQKKLGGIASCSKSKEIAQEFASPRFGKRLFEMVCHDVPVFYMTYAPGDPSSREQEVMILPGVRCEGKPGRTRVDVYG